MAKEPLVTGPPPAATPSKYIYATALLVNPAPYTVMVEPAPPVTALAYILPLAAATGATVSADASSPVVQDAKNIVKNRLNRTNTYQCIFYVFLLLKRVAVCFDFCQVYNAEMRQKLVALFRTYVLVSFSSAKTVVVASESAEADERGNRRE